MSTSTRKEANHTGRRRRAAVLGVSLAIAAALLVSAELFARYVLGLGDPPLTVRDPEIEYMFAPSRCYERFHNRICYNRYSMRATRDISQNEHKDRELRILVMGDSVVNGGALTDDSELATVIAEKELREVLGVPVWVANISAGSWGPGNLLAYSRRYGWFDADFAIIVVSSHDLADVPTFDPDLGPNFPEYPPILALQEAIVRYLPRYFPHLGRAASGRADTTTERERSGLELFRSLLSEAKAHVSNVVVLHHFEKSELAHPNGNGKLARYAFLLEGAAQAEGVPFIDLAPWLRTPPQPDPFRDTIHLSAEGQRRLAAAIECVVLRSLGREVTTCQ